MSDGSLIPHSSVSEYFHEVISEALRNQGVAASAHAEFYLVNLLCEYSHSSLSDEPLTLLLLEANEAEPSVRLRKLRRIGDHSLYVTGFFADSLERRRIDADYYITLGGTAYASLARSGAQPFCETYKELADNFPQLVEVLMEVSQRTPTRSSTDIVQLYERYLRTGSRNAEQRLRRLGLGVVHGRKGPSA
jgi:hypothetical protein